MERLLNERGAFERIETLFPAKQNTFLEKKQLEMELNRKNDSVVRFLKKEKNKNINIAILPKIKQFGSYKKVIQHIQMMDDKLCTETFLINLTAYLPSRDDDLTLMQKYLKGPEEKCQELDYPEQFIIEMARMYRYETRLKYMLFRAQFWDRFEQIRKSLSIVLSASNSLRHSKPFRDLLFIILSLGNFMNASSTQGGAFGMKISSINKLMDTKASKDSNITLLHVLTGLVEREMPSILSFVDDLKDIPEAARVMASISEIVQQYSDLRQGLKQLEAELDEFWTPKSDAKKNEENETQEIEAVGQDNGQETHDYNDRFLAVMKEFKSSAVGRFEELGVLYVNVDVKWKDVMSFYGENPHTKRPDEFFGTIAYFLQSWKNAALEEQRRMRQKEIEERRLRELEERRRQALKARDSPFPPSSNSISSSSSEDEIEDRRLMDDLLEKLRSGETENKLQQRRVRQRLKKLKSNDESSFQNLSLDSLKTTLSRTLSSSSSASSGSIPAISAEDLLKSLQQEEDE
ncbi:Disheveled-associated activator of morphogenesis 1 [Choanephora cucurbitarum]|uniref:Disheveled-associated activator of morphogenesis 1 n=1 Tax=Choanephora cucurbitarum TaxID=101091 RepID=A0A1C7NFR3_9FUNG|nr:Disheveled-associated activator of morphogenesis 1 [Choanephora cucurbitarum]